jgi:hypothetical protein
MRRGHHAVGADQLGAGGEHGLNLAGQRLSCRRPTRRGRAELDDLHPAPLAKCVKKADPAAPRLCARLCGPRNSNQTGH